MAMSAFSGISVILTFLLLAVSAASAQGEDEQKEHVLTLDHTNFTETVSKHKFIVVEFYAPWCGHCQRLAPEYEKAASLLSSHDPPITLAKIDVSDKVNSEIATKFKIQGFPTIKILRSGGNAIQEYKGPREADGIVTYLKKQTGPSSAEIKSREDSAKLIDEKRLFVVGVFPVFSGESFQNFSILAEKLRGDYDFGHTLDGKLLPHGGPVDKPTLRLLKPFDELFADFQDFHVDQLEKFIEEASIPTVTIYDKNEENIRFVKKLIYSPDTKALLFVNFSRDFDAFKSKYHEVASGYERKEIRFLLGDTEAAAGVLTHFGLKADQAPVILIQSTDGKNYLKPNVKPDDIASWVKDYKEGKLKPYIKSEPIPEVNNEPVKVVVADNLEDFVFNSGKNVLIEFYAPWCGHCKKLAPILDEVAVSFENDPDVTIAKMDATANDITSNRFEVEGFPTLYFVSASGNLVKYEGDRSKEDFIDFIQENRDIRSNTDSAASKEPAKDEL
ncbi:PREDICTED: protein disulfide-isomerase-like [Ipomoea nil]|uniref:protein disulfide-isomerase-like n=1 Tax=Ipomoea nil TaxID=35883 RepID=UPI000900E723|nr:PREDICTED: protein disulfide-isomerase-like [Ipomoea nil]